MKEPRNSNKVFSDDNKDMESTNFQTEHMKNKIKNIKKRTKILNIQNIEPLVNIHDKPTAQPSQSNQKEGFTFRDDDWTGDDSIYEGGKKAGVSESRSFAQLIEDAYKKMTDGYDKMIFNFTKAASSDGKHINSDKGHLKKYINWMLAIIVASIGVYNWCFIMFYRDVANTRVKAWNVPRDYINTCGSYNPFCSFIKLFTDIPLFFTDFFKKFIIDWIPDTIMSKIDDPRSRKSYDVVLISLFMFILTASVFMVNGSGEVIKNIIVDLAKLEFTGVLPIIIYTVSAILFILTFMETHPIAALLPIGGFISFAKFFNPMFWVEKVVLLVYLIFVGVPLATATLIGYILFHTFFGLFYNGHNILDTKAKFDEFLNRYKPEERQNTSCNPLSFFEKIINYMIKIFNYIYDNCIKLGFMSVMLYALIDSLINVKDNNLKWVIGLIVFGCILGVGSIIKTLQVIYSDDPQPSTEENITPPTVNETRTRNHINIPNLESIPTTDTINNIANNLPIPEKETFTKMVDNLNVTDNTKIQDGLKSGIDILSNFK